MGKFRKKTILGVDYVMDHLNDFMFSLDQYSIKVMFSCHCFTEGHQLGQPPDLTYRYGNEMRLFSIERHRLSAQLPELIKGLGNTTVYHTKVESFFFIKTSEQKPYVVFLRTYKSSSPDYNVIVDVESAYAKENITQWAAPVKFSTVIRFASQGKRPPTGNPVQIKRK